MSKYCDYDAIVHYLPGSFCTKHKTELAGKLQKIDLDKSLTENDIKSFKNCYYNTYITLEPLVLYRIYGQYQSNPQTRDGQHLRGAKLQGRYVSTEFAESIIDAKMRLALHPKWFNTKMYEAKLLIPKGTKVSVGIVGGVTLPSGTFLPGGADQLLLPYGWPKEWVQGHRHVTTRQLQSPPHYSRQQPAGIAEEKNALYPHLCPLCGSDRIRRLEKSEQFEIIGIHGNRYIMKSKCLNPECEYHW